MKTVRLLAAAGVVLATLGNPLRAQVSAQTQTVTFSVSAINQLAVSGNPGPLNVSTASAGGQPVSVSDASTTYSVTTNEADKKISASINSAMPSGVTLTVSLAAPGGASTAGAVPLTTSPADLVTNIDQVNATGLTITYTLSALPTAGTVTSQSRTVTLSLMSSP